MISGGEISEAGKAFEKLLSIVQKLRSPDGCPWDREQTHETLRPYLIEEVYELIESIERKNISEMMEELGDILLHVLFHADICRENEDFTIVDVMQNLCDKLTRRHPHVFGEVEVAGSDEVLHNWENIKLSERRNGNEEASLLDGIPRTMPALLVAQRMQEKAARIGFDWTDVKDVLAKIREEMDELVDELNEDDNKKLANEIGDLLFTIVNLARFRNINAEMALMRTNSKFDNRFRYIEKKLRQNNITNPSLEIMDNFWEESKEHET